MTKLSALVTGASRGIGRAIALALHDEGYAVIAVARPSDALDQLESRGFEAWAMDATAPDFFARVGDLETLDLLVNNLGTARHARLEDTPEADIDFVLRTNLAAPLKTSRAAIPALRGGGCIVSITSQMGHVGAKERAVYCATKFGLEGMTKALAVELGPDDIRVNAVAPTFVETPLTAATLADPDKHAAIMNSLPLRRLPDAREIADAVLYLARARNVTGHSLRVDGGWTAR